MTAKDNKTKQAEFKTRMRESGFTQMAVWVHLDDKDKVKQYIDRLKKARTK